MFLPALLALPGSAARLHPLDLGLIVVYLVGITLFGLRFRAKKVDGATPAQSLQSYFLADNTIPWWAIALSIVSAETSTLTIISIPGVAFSGDFGFLQIVLGYMIGRLVVAAIFLPLYFEGRMLTAYQLIDQRFGSALHKVTAGLFLLTRAAAEGVRVFAVSIVVGIAIGTGDILSIGIITLLTLLYTFEGGMAAVIWTDVVQMGIYIFGTAVALITLGSHVPGGWPTIHSVAGAAGKFHMFHFALNLTQTYTFWAGILGGTFLTMASHGTDQLMVQRMLAARSLKESRLALLSSGLVIFIQFAFFLLIGAGLYVFYGFKPTPIAGGPAGLMSPDRIFPTFIVDEMPTGIAGLLVAAILAAAMSNLSAALNSLSSTTVVDFYLPWRSRTRPGDPSSTGSLLTGQGEVPSIEAPPVSPTSPPGAPSLAPFAQGGVDPASTLEVSGKERNLVARFSTVFWAVLLFAVAAYSVKAGGKGHVVETGLSIASVAYGALLGVFLLGTLTRYATQTGAILGMIVGFAFNLTLWLHPTPILIGPMTIPHIAFTWYVFLGSVLTFATGSIASLCFRKQSGTRRQAAIGVAVLAFLVVIPEGNLRLEAQKKPAPRTTSAAATSSAAYDFTPISTVINAAIAEKKLPGAVVLVGHNDQVVFHHAYGVRKLAGEPGLDGSPSPAEPMTEDTIFDMASLTKCLATATAIMQLYEAGKLEFDDPIQKFLPAFNAAGDPERAKVTVRMMLTHYSGEAEDVDLKDAWGLTVPDKIEGIRRALASPLKSAPGETFRYSDINFITLGAIVEKLSGEPEDVYARNHIFLPLKMTHTRYLPLDKACGPVLEAAPGTPAAPSLPCPPGEVWKRSEWIPGIAPTAHDDESKAYPFLNPGFDRLLRGVVHDPTTRRMGGVAGHAGVFSTAADVALYAQALLDKLTRNTGPFPLKQATLRLMTQHEQPRTAQTNAVVFTADGQPAKGTATRGFGWDINTSFSRPRGSVFPIGSFGHTGFTGTTLWMDPGSNTFVVLLANAIHPRGGAPISPLRGLVATAAARAIGVQGTPLLASSAGGSIAAPIPTRTLIGIDVLEQSRFSQLADAAKRHQGHLNLGILTNIAGVDAQGRRTIDVIATDAAKAVPQLRLTTLFAAEHGLSARQETTAIAAEVDDSTHLPITSLYGPKPGDRRPTHAQLANLDVVLIDLQDVGNRFWTFDTVTGYFLEASAAEAREHNHYLEIIVLDHPNPTSGTTFAVQGPVSDPGRQSYVDYTPLPARHGMTIGELARFYNGEASPSAQATEIFNSQSTASNNAPKGLGGHLTVIPLQNWTREQFLDDAGVAWTNPSPNLRSLTAATFYPGIGLFETTNVSVGRGTATPFEHFGAPYMTSAAMIACLAPRKIPGVSFEPTTVTIAETRDRYPYHGQTIPGVHLVLTDRKVLDAPELGIEIISCLRRLYPIQFDLDHALRIIANADTLARLQRNDDPRTIAASWQPALDDFLRRRTPYLLYPQTPTP